MSTLQQSTRPMDSNQVPTEANGTNHPATVERIIKPNRGWIAIDWAEIYQSRELFDTLIRRDIKVRYKQTVLGIAWAVLQPLATVFVFTVVFSNFPGVAPEGTPYPLFLLAGTVPWTFFANSVTAAGISLLNQERLMTKIYFPRLYVPSATVGTYLVDMVIGLSLFGLLMPYYRFVPSYQILLLPLVILLTFAAAIGLGLIFASLTVLYRDLRFIIPFALNLMLYASPIFYQPSALPLKAQRFIALNPVTGIISAYRWCILASPIDLQSLAISVFTTIVVLVFGLFYFRRTERYIADLL